MFIIPNRIVCKQEDNNPENTQEKCKKKKYIYFEIFEESVSQSLIGCVIE